MSDDELAADVVVHADGTVTGLEGGVGAFGLGMLSREQARMVRDAALAQTRIEYEREALTAGAVPAGVSRWSWPIGGLEVEDTVDPFTWSRALKERPEAMDHLLSPYLARERLIERYAWAIPTERALAAIAALGPVLEVGAGSGYWAHLLRERGVNVIAVDHAINGDAEEYPLTRTGAWTRVEQGDALTVARHPFRTLFLSWPPMDRMAVTALAHHRGDYVAYIGEGEGGCTADDEFHALLEDRYDEVASVLIPRWQAINDRLTIHRRRTQRLLPRVTPPRSP